MINVIVPFSRKLFFKNVIENFKRQKLQNKRLIIIENGDGVGVFKNCTLPYKVLSSGQHHALAKNEGIRWLRNNGGGWWTTMDDDDYYGPNYLLEIDENKHKADVIGKFSRFMTDGYRLICLRGLYENDYSCGALGPTITARAEDCCEFKELVHDDSAFVSDMMKVGAKIYNTSIYNFAHYRLNHKHMWTATIDNIIYDFVIARGGTAIEYDFNIDVINGKIDFGFGQNIRPLISDNNKFINFIRSCGVEPDLSTIYKLKDNA